MSPDGPPARAPQQNASEGVASQIRLYVETESLPPGHRLGREEDLAKRFGVSRPTLREALRLLSSAHVIRAERGRGGGIFVANTAEESLGLSVSESVATMVSARSISMEELLEARMLLEVPLVGLVAHRADPEDVATMRAVLEDARTGEGEGDGETIARLDAALNQLIPKAAGNRLLESFTQWIGDVLQPKLREVIRPAIVESVAVAQHEAILEAIEQNDPAEAERAMREHLAYLADLVTAVRRREPGSTAGLDPAQTASSPT